MSNRITHIEPITADGLPLSEGQIALAMSIEDMPFFLKGSTGGRPGRLMQAIDELSILIPDTTIAVVYSDDFDDNCSYSARNGE